LRFESAIDNGIEARLKPDLNTCATHASVLNILCTSAA
jgi:hypothetical protein